MIEYYPLNSNFPSISLSCPESNIGVTHSFPCPCLDNPGGGAKQPNVTRTCRGNFISKAVWQPVDYNQCGFTDITFKLCETQLVCTLHAKRGKVTCISYKTCTNYGHAAYITVNCMFQYSKQIINSNFNSSVVYLNVHAYIRTKLLRTSPEQAATDLANITSSTAETHAVDVSVVTSIIEDLTTAVTLAALNKMLKGIQLCMRHIMYAHLGSYKMESDLLIC